MKARRWTVAVLCAAMALLALPLGASAKPGYVVKSKSLDLHFKLPADNGYKIKVETDGHKQINLTVEKGSFTAFYSVSGKVSRKGIEADFGQLGNISLRFQGRKRIGSAASSLPNFLRSKCKGRPTVRERGVFLGNFRFQGERGFTRATAHRIKGTVVRSYKRVCQSQLDARASTGKARDEFVAVEAAAKESGRYRFFSAAEASLTTRSGRQFEITIGSVFLLEKPDRVAILKLLFLIEKGSSIKIGPATENPLAAEVTMPKPFEGIASYVEEGSAPPTWSGAFGVHLPGSGLVPLTGPEFEAGLCRASSEREFDRCLEPQIDLQPYGSGSHSQPLALARLSSLR